MSKMLLTITSDPKNISKVESYLQHLKNDLRIQEDRFADILISITEAVNNAIIHGNKVDKTKKVNISSIVEDKNLNITVTDEGNGFDPDKIPDPRCPERIEFCGGRGVMIMSNLCDKLSYKNNGSTVNLLFSRVISH